MSFSASVEILVAESNNGLVSKADWWGRVPLVKVAKVINGFPLKSESFSSQNGVPVIRIRDVTSGKISTFYTGLIPEGYWIDKGDILIGMDGDFNCRIWESERALLNQRVCKIEPNEEKINKQFLFYALPGYLRLINDATHSITVKHLSSKTIGEIPLAYPPLNEQRRIVAKLDRLFARSRCAREELGRVSGLVQRYKQAILAAAFRGDLTADWREENTDVETAPELLKRIQAKRQDLPNQKRKSIGGGRSVSDSFETPATWLGLTLGDVIDYGKTVKSEPDEIPHDAWVLELEDIEKDKSKLLQRMTFAQRLSKSTKNRFVAGDVLYGKLRPYLNKVLIADQDGYCTTEIIPIKANIGVHECYLFYWLKHPEFLNYVESVSHGIQMPRLGTEAGLQAPFILAPIQEQKEIVQRVEKLFKAIDLIEQEHQKASKLLDRLEQATLSKAFRGELVPQDPNDEPAAVLLERIQSDRQAQPKGKAIKSKQSHR